MSNKSIQNFHDSFYKDYIINFIDTSSNLSPLMQSSERYNPFTKIINEGYNIEIDEIQAISRRITNLEQKMDLLLKGFMEIKNDKAQLQTIIECIQKNESELKEIKVKFKSDSDADQAIDLFFIENLEFQLSVDRSFLISNFVLKKIEEKGIPYEVIEITNSSESIPESDYYQYQKEAWEEIEKKYDIKEDDVKKFGLIHVLEDKYGVKKG